MRGRGARVEPLDGAAVQDVVPLVVEAIRLVEVVLEQLAVSDVDRLRDHVGVGVLRDGRVDQPRMVLRVDVLLDRAAGAADAHGVERDAVVLDEVLLQHQRRLAAELQVVVRVGAQAGRVHAPRSRAAARRAAAWRCRWWCPACARSRRRPARLKTSRPFQSESSGCVRDRSPSSARASRRCR